MIMVYLRLGGIMNSTFRSEVFKLCKILQKKDEAKQIGELIHNLSVSSENKITGEVRHTLHGDFAYVAKHSRNQFQGFLFVDDNVDKLKFQIPLKIEPLTKSERELIERGHRTLIKFIEMCLDDISKKSLIVAEAMNPYFLFKEVIYDDSLESLLTDDEMAYAVKLFKEGKIYKTLIASKVEKLFENIDKQKMSILIGTLEKEIGKCFDENIPSDLREFSYRLIQKKQYKDITDVMLSFCILIIALKESLSVICQLFYEAICGADLIVLNNDNIIRIENRSVNSICETFKVLIQGMCYNYSSDGVKSILLLDCDPANEKHIHEFGVITAITCSFSADMGNTTKYTFATLDEEMIYIKKLTDDIIRVGLLDISISK